MDRGFLKRCLDDGLSLNQIGALVNRTGSTVGYWVKKHGLVANGKETYAPRGGIVPEVLEQLVDEGATLSEMAAELGRSTSSVRHWLGVYGLRPTGGRARRQRAKPGDSHPKRRMLECGHHGRTDFVLEGRGYYRCVKCRSAAVAKRRRDIKRALVEEAGGRCQICGYDRYVGALQFHHLDPSAKSFALSTSGITRSLERQREEAKKCLVLCANCHAEIEAGLISIPD